MDYTLIRFTLAAFISFCRSREKKPKQLVLWLVKDCKCKIFLSLCCALPSLTHVYFRVDLTANSDETFPEVNMQRSRALVAIEPTSWEQHGQHSATPFNWAGLNFKKKKRLQPTGMHVPVLVVTQKQSCAQITNGIQIQQLQPLGRKENCILWTVCAF